MNVRAAIGLTPIAACALVFGACSKRVPSSPPAVFEVADLAVAGDAGAVERTWYDATRGTMSVTNITRFEIESATMQPGPTGNPAIAFTVSRPHREPFEKWTGARAGRVAAVLLDSRIVMCTMITDPLPGAGVIDFGQTQPSIQELGDLIQRMEPR